MGYSTYTYGSENRIGLIRANLSGRIGKIGTITAKDYWEEDVHYLEVVLTLDTNEYVFDDTYLYVGPLKNYPGRYFTNFPFRATDDLVDMRVFKIPFSEIILQEEPVILTVDLRLPHSIMGQPFF